MLGLPVNIYDAAAAVPSGALSLDSLTFWEAAVKSSPAVVALCLGCILIALRFIADLRKEMREREEKHEKRLEERDQRYLVLHEKTLTAIADNTAVMRELVTVIKKNGRA